MIRLVCIVEVEDANTVAEAQLALDNFREAVLPSSEHGLTIYRATEADADAAYYQPDDDEDCDDACRDEETP